MKTFKYIVPVAALFAITGLVSCQKKFDPSSYAPKLNINGYTATADVAKSNLVAYYAFDGSLIDSVSKTSGTNTGTSFTAGIKGKAMQGATNSYVLATPSDAVKNMTSFTVTTWINTAPPSTGIIGFFSLSNSTAFWGNIEGFFENGSTNTNGKVRIHITSATGNDVTLAVDNVQNLFGKWTALAFSYDETTSTASLYVNGALVNASKLTNLTGPLAFKNVGQMVFGTVQFMTTPSLTSATGSQPWASFNTGQYDELRIYNRALTLTEISTIVNLQNRGK